MKLISINLMNQFEFAVNTLYNRVFTKQLDSMSISTLEFGLDQSKMNNRKQKLMRMGLRRWIRRCEMILAPFEM